MQFDCISHLLCTKWCCRLWWRLSHRVKGRDSSGFWVKEKIWGDLSYILYGDDPVNWASCKSTNFCWVTDSDADLSNGPYSKLFTVFGQFTLGAMLMVITYKRWFNIYLIFIIVASRAAAFGARSCKTFMYSVWCQPYVSEEPWWSSFTLAPDVTIPAPRDSSKPPSWSEKKAQRGGV